MATDNFDSNELFNIYLQKMGSIPLLSREDEIEVARRIAEQGNDAEIAKQTLITANLRLGRFDRQTILLSWHATA